MDYLVTMRRSEVTWHAAWVEENPDDASSVNGVTDWQQREYFTLF